MPTLSAGHPTPSWSSPPRRRPWFSSRKVRETLTTRFAKCLCSTFLTLLLIVGVILFVLWLSLRPHRPRFHLAALSASGLATGPPTSLGSVSFNLTDRNSNQKIGVYYDAIFGSVFYREKLVASGPVMFPFYQQPKNTTVIAAQLTGADIGGSGALPAQLSGDAAAGRVELRLDLNSTIRFKVKTWDTRQHHLHVECNVAVGKDGNLLPEFRDVRCAVYF